jgi:outer membrane scaffolding protein for murein synthesis (MipA/OmpV family)
MMRSLSVFVSLAAALASVPAAAQDAPDTSTLNGDRITVGAGAVYSPSYRGSDNYSVSPIPVIIGQIGGVEINPRAGGVALDLIQDNRDSGFGFSLGPVASYTANRARGIRDDVVRASGKLDEAVELGGTVGVTAYKLLNPYDSLTLSADVRWDVASAHKGMVWSPSVTYMTPLSRGSLVALTASASHVDDDFTQYYYSVTPGQSARTGGVLPVYGADGGWDAANIGLLGALDLDGNLLNGGFQLLGIAAYSRMLGDGKDTPFTSIRGDADQWIGGLGLAYTF